MNNWKDAWFIFYSDLRKDRIHLIWNVVFMAYMGFVLSGVVSTTAGNHDLVTYKLPDLLIIMLIPFTGFLFSRKSFNYLKEDSYSQMLIYYRSLPIPSKVIILARYMQMAFAILLNSAIMYSLIYVMLSSLNSMNSMNFMEYIVVALTWIGYALIINAVYIHLELLCKGQVYFWWTVVIVSVSAVVAIVINMLAGNIMNYTITSAEQYGFASPIMWGMLMIGIVAIVLIGKLTQYKLERRSFAS